MIKKILQAQKKDRTEVQPLMFHSFQEITYADPEPSR